MTSLVVEIEHAHPRLRLDETTLRTLIDRVFEAEASRLAYLGVVLTDHETVYDLNVEYLGHDYQTDVLAFPLSESDGVVDGEVYVDLDTAAERAPEFNTTFEEEAQRYVVHGLLHLMGYDDKTPEGKAQMHKRENHYLGVRAHPPDM